MEGGGGARAAAGYRRLPLSRPLLRTAHGDRDRAQAVAGWVSVLSLHWDIKPAVAECELAADASAAPGGLVSVRAVVRTGITAPSLRDEIFCQVCKQIRWRQ